MLDVLPKAVVKDLLASWLTLSCVGRLDSALCVHDYRSQMLIHLQASSFGKNLLISQNSESDVFFEWILKRKIKLKVIGLNLHRNLISNWKLRSDVLALIGKRLENVTIKANRHVETAWLDGAVMDIASRCTSLKVCDFNRFSDTNIATLLARNPKMERVSLHNCVSPRESEILHLVGLFCPRILTIDLQCDVKDRSFQQFLTAIPPTLQSLCLPNCTSFTWATIVDLLQQCSDLHELRVSNIGAVNHKPPLDLTCRGMRTFRADFAYLSETTIIMLSKLMPNLTTIVILTTRMVNFNPEVHCAFVKSILENFVYLRQLVFVLPCEDKLRPIPHHTINKDMTGDIPRPGSLLEELYVTHPAECLSIVSLPALRTLGFRNYLTPSGLPPQLTRVVLHRHLWINDSAPSFLHLSGLEEIDVVFSHSLSDHVMRKMAIQNPHLQVLRLEQTQLGAQSAMSAEGLWIFLKHCPRLHTIVYTASHSARKTEYANPSCAILLKALRATYPNLKSLFFSID